MKSLAIALLLITSSLAYADCVTYQGGFTECIGPRGYYSQQREYQGGVAESHDNRGNYAMTQRHQGGYTTVTAPTGMAPSVAPAPPPVNDYGMGRRGIFTRPDPFAPR